VNLRNAPLRGAFVLFTPWVASRFVIKPALLSSEVRMLSKKLLVSLLFAAPVLLPATAYAQDEDEDEDSSSSSSSHAKKHKDDQDEPGSDSGKDDVAKIREIVRGAYLKSDVGGAIFLTNGDVVQPGTLVGLSFGQDFVDREKESMAWELGIWQGLHNGVDLGTQMSTGGCQISGGAYLCTEGDLRTYAATLNYEISFYPLRRLGLGARVGAGVLYSPLFILSDYYQQDFVSKIGGDPGVHNAFHPLGFGGVTAEYYTKLSHFSVGADVDVSYALNWALGLNLSGYLKYTF